MIQALNIFFGDLSDIFLEKIIWILS